MGDKMEWYKNLTPTTPQTLVSNSWNDFVSNSRSDTGKVPDVDLSKYGLSAGGIGNSGKLYQGVELSDDAVKAITDAGDASLLTKEPGFLEQAGIIDDKGNLFGMGKDTWGAVTGLASMYDTLFGTGADIREAQLDTLGAQKDLLKQQLASNKEALENRRTFNRNWSNASNAVMGNGLAGSAVRGA